MKKLSREDLDKLDLKDDDKIMYYEALKIGAQLYLIEETEDGYDISILFSPDISIKNNMDAMCDKE